MARKIFKIFLMLMVTLGALPAAAQQPQQGDASDLNVTERRAPQQQQVFSTRAYRKELDAQEMRIARPSGVLRLQRVPSPYQRLPRGNNDLLTPDQPDTIKIVEVDF